MGLNFHLPPHLHRHVAVLLLIATLGLHASASTELHRRNKSGDDQRRSGPSQEDGWTAGETATTTAQSTGEEEVFGHSAFTDSPITQGGVWPLPQKMQYGGQNRSIRRDSIVFTFRGVRDVDCDILNNARKIYCKQTPSTGSLYGCSDRLNFSEGVVLPHQVAFLKCRCTHGAGASPEEVPGPERVPPTGHE